MRSQLILLALVGNVALANATPIKWPVLPTSGFVAGRAATADDMKRGAALFMIGGNVSAARVQNRSVGKPLRVTIPQYAFWTDQHGNQIPVIVIQAEEDQGKQVFGFRDFSGKGYAALRQELQLLGTHHPQ